MTLLPSTSKTLETAAYNAYKTAFYAAEETYKAAKAKLEAKCHATLEAAFAIYKKRLAAVVEDNSKAVHIVFAVAYDAALTQYNEDATQLWIEYETQVNAIEAEYTTARNTK